MGKAISLKRDLAATWALAKPYWTSEERWPARGVYALIVGLDLLHVYLIVRMTYWNANFLDALVALDTGAFWRLMWEFAVIVIIGIVVEASRTWFYQWLEIRWRGWLTEVYLGRWLAGKAYYRIDSASGIDNPDQRIAEDLKLMASGCLTLSLDFIQNCVNLVSYSVVVWGLSGSIAFTLGGVGFDVPGYMLWVAFAYAVLGSLLLEKLAFPLVRVDYELQQREAHFRYGLVRVRESAEQIAFYSGAPAEHLRLRTVFGGVRANWRRIMDYTKRITIFKKTYIEFGAYIPQLIIAPRYFAHLITLGQVQQMALSFSRLRAAMSWYIFSFKDLATLRSAVRRLAEFDQALHAPAPHGIASQPALPGEGLRATGLRLALPDGRDLVRVDALAVDPGERWLLRGASGQGKSTLLRALAGLWPYGSGSIAWPQGKVMFVPQKSYMPVGTLRDCLCYPSDADAFDAEACARALEAVNLGNLVGRLDDEDQWDRCLSPGEQQRVAFARVLLHRPDYLFLDEATSALDADNEAHLYALLVRSLPAVALVSVAHRASVRAFHTRVLELEDGVCKESAQPAAA